MQLIPTSSGHKKLSSDVLGTGYGSERTGGTEEERCLQLIQAMSTLFDDRIPTSTTLSVNPTGFTLLRLVIYYAHASGYLGAFQTTGYNGRGSPPV
jgi:hypothetical protein